MKSLKQLPTIANVAKGNTVTLTLPVGNVYEVVALQYAGVTAAQLKNIRLECNGRMVSEWVDGERLLSMDKHYDRPAQANTLFFNFARPELHQLSDRRFFGLDTNPTQGITTAHIKFDIDAAASAPVLNAYAVTTQSVANVPNYLTKARRFIAPVSAAGQFDIDNLPRPQGASISAIHMYMPDGSDADGKCQITKAELLVDNVNWHDIDADIARTFQSANGRTPETDKSTVIDLILDGDVKHALPLTQNIQDFRIRASAVETGQVEVMVEYVDVWGAGRF